MQIEIDDIVHYVNAGDKYQVVYLYSKNVADLKLIETHSNPSYNIDHIYKKILISGDPRIVQIIKANKASKKSRFELLLE